MRGLILFRIITITKEKLYEKERYSFPLKLYNERFETYKGYNVNFLIKVEVFLYSLLKKIDFLSIYTPKERTALARYLHFKNSAFQYQVYESKETLLYKATTNNFLGLIFIYLLGLVVYLSLYSPTFNTFWGFTISMLIFFWGLEYFCSTIMKRLFSNFKFYWWKSQ